MEVVIIVLAVAIGLLFYWLYKSTQEFTKANSPDPIVKLGPEPIEEKTTTITSQPVVEQPVVEQPVVEQAAQTPDAPARKKRTRKPAAMTTSTTKTTSKAVKKVK